MRPCPSRLRELSDMVDGALSVRGQENLHDHLVACQGCRAELASLRSVRERLRATGSSAPTSEALTSRLIDIAGDGAGEPLYARPFDPPGDGALPSRRRTRRTVAGAVTVTCLFLAGLMGVGWAAAPPTRAPAVDPAPVVREEFAALLADTPLANPAVSAVRAVEADTAKTEKVEGPPVPEFALASEGAPAVLERASQARGVTAYAGIQLVQVRHLAGYWETRVDVEARPGQGAQVRVHDTANRAAVVPQSPAALTDLVGRHELLTGPGPEVAGHPTVVVEARAHGAARARWWIEPQSGVVVWEQTYDPNGTVVLSAGFRTLAIGAVSAPRHLPPKLTPARNTAALTVSSAADLHRQGWQLPDQVAGLQLFAMRGDRSQPMLHSVYGDGVFALSFLQQKGALHGAPEGFVWDPQVGAYRSLGITTVFTWQSGDMVLTVATDGPAELAERAVSELPRARPALRTPTERILDGWRHLIRVDR